MKTSKYRLHGEAVVNGGGSTIDAETVREVLAGFFRRPKERLLFRWNWKSALLSPLGRATVFFMANLAAGYMAAFTAMAREFVFRAVASGFYGGITESFRSVRPRWAGTLSVVFFLPLLNHSAELLFHWMLGTPNLKSSILASVCYTTLTTGFNLYAMRRGILITAPGRQSLIRDLIMIPGLMLSFCLDALRSSRSALLMLLSFCRQGWMLFSLRGGSET